MDGTSRHKVGTHCYELQSIDRPADLARVMPTSLDGTYALGSRSDTGTHLYALKIALVRMDIV